MTDDRAELERECRAMAAYLTGRACSPAVVDAYVDAHAGGTVTSGASIGRLDAALLARARRGAGGTALADAYASVFARTSVFRRKLVLVVALLETTAPDYRELEAPAATSFAAFALSTSAAVAGLVLRLLIALPWFGTLAFLQRSRPGAAGDAAS